MKLSEKLLLLVTAVIIGAGVLCYTFNLDIYRSVENMNPIKGYAEFVNSLTDEEFVLSHYENWKGSSSWVLGDLHQFLTEESTELNTFSLLFTQAVITLAFYYGMACIPFIIVCFIRIRQRSKKGSELRNAGHR